MLDDNGFRVRLRQARIKAGLSVPYVSKRMDVHPQWVYGWEGIGELPNLEDFASLCECYNADPKWLLFGGETADAEKGK